MVNDLEMKMNMTKVAPDSGNYLSVVNQFMQKKGAVGEMEERLAFAEEKVWGWGTAASVAAGQSMLWECGAEEAGEYLQVVDDIQKLIESLESLSIKSDQEETDILQRADSVLQTAMVRLEEEFSYMLVQNRQPLELELSSFRSSEGYVTEEDFSSCFDDDSIDDSQVKLEGIANKFDEFTVDLINPSVIQDLKCIADLMIQSDHDLECCQAYSSIRRDALDEGLFILGIQKLSIEEVEKMEWEILDSYIRKWIRAIKIFVRVLLASEKRLCNQIFGELSSLSNICFVDTAKGAMLQLLNFGDAIAISRRSPEKLFGILGMHDVLQDLLTDIETLFSEENGSSVRVEAHEVLLRLGESVRGTFMEFENAIERNVSSTPFARGGIHPLTKYVMNYIKTLTAFKDSLDLLLEIKEGGHESPTVSSSTTGSPEGSNGSYSRSLSPTVHNLLEVVSMLESNLDMRSRLYRDDALQHFFLMNNIHYMVQKVKGSDLCLLGEDWIRRHNRKVQVHATNYERASWNTVLAWLKDDGIGSGGSKAVKERLKGFNFSFEEIYKNQTSWIVPDPGLREDLQISISLKVVQGYRTFTGRLGSYLDGTRSADKYMKYTAEDLETLLLDLFEGSPRSLNSQRGRR
ncbi:Exocyst complex component [Nymphaea thermarum]|nr:Exocyst complex component [Nymphaea thermarum]